MISVHRICDAFFWICLACYWRWLELRRTRCLPMIDASGASLISSMLIVSSFNAFSSFSFFSTANNQCNLSNGLRMNSKCNQNCNQIRISSKNAWNKNQIKNIHQYEPFFLAQFIENDFNFAMCLYRIPILGFSLMHHSQLFVVLCAKIFGSCIFSCYGQYGLLPLKLHHIDQMVTRNWRRSEIPLEMFWHFVVDFHEFALFVTIRTLLRAFDTTIVAQHMIARCQILFDHSCWTGSCCWRFKQFQIGQTIIARKCWPTRIQCWMWHCCTICLARQFDRMLSGSFWF